ncbi:MAG TPA: hypothetical protein VMH35_04965 [Streptosporangiaceae bacterium]|nr:hypothetical protein [Streptosporangiaceae bacterium]
MGAVEATLGAARASGRPSLVSYIARHADGVIVASALMRRVLDGATVTEVGQAVRELRAAVDGARR